VTSSRWMDVVARRRANVRMFANEGRARRPRVVEIPNFFVC